MNKTFGPDHKALEGFDEYEESLEAALVDEMISLLKADLAKDTPMPSVLQQEKEKDRKAEQARLAEAVKGAARAKAVLGASAKPKPRPRSKSPHAPGAYGSRAELQSRILEQAKVYTATVKKIVPTSSNCDDLGRAVMSYRQALDQRQPMKLACFDSDRIRKIDFDNEGEGNAYTDSGETYGRILERLAEAEIDPAVPITEDWLPTGAGAWLFIDGNKKKDHPRNRYNCQPFLYEDWSPKDQLCWREASMELNKALRHPSTDPPSLCLPLDENGWASTLDCIRFLRPKVSRCVGIAKPVVDRICSYNWLLGVTLCDKKHRFQLAGATGPYGILAEGDNILSFGFIRAKSGHSGYIAEMVNRPAYSWVSPYFANSISCICHKTQRQYIREIFYNGLKPGEMIRAGGRKHVNLSPFLPHDTRNTAVGRTHNSYHTIVIFNKDRVLNEHEMLMSANGIVATTEVLHSDLFSSYMSFLQDNMIGDGSCMVLTFGTLSHVGIPIPVCHNHIFRTRRGRRSV